MFFDYFAFYPPPPPPKIILIPSATEIANNKQKFFYMLNGVLPCFILHLINFSLASLKLGIVLLCLIDILSQKKKKT